jgi:hypothetical protein
MSKEQKKSVRCKANRETMDQWRATFRMQLSLTCPAKSLILDLSGEQWNQYQADPTSPAILGYFERASGGFDLFLSNKALAVLIYEILDRESDEAKEFVRSQSEKPQRVTLGRSCRCPQGPSSLP